MKALTVKDLLICLLKEHDKGHDDYTVFVTDDEEANGYHALYYVGQTPSEMTKEQREYCEQFNQDYNFLENKDKAYYIG